MSWESYGNFAFYVCATVTMLFALLYLVSAPWWETVGGRNIMAVMGSVALAFVYFAWAISAGGIPAGFHQTRAILFTGIALSIGWRVVILIRYHILRSLRKSPPIKEGNEDDLEDAR